MPGTVCVTVCNGNSCFTGCNVGGTQAGGGHNLGSHSNSGVTGNGIGNASNNNSSKSQNKQLRGQIAQIADSKKNIDDTNAAIAAANDAINKASSNTAKESLSTFQIGLLVALGLVMLPEAVLAVGSATLTALSIGPVVEGATIELLANSAFMQAASRAGAIMGAGKYLNVLGVFSSTKAAVNIAEKHPLEGWTAAQVVQKAKELGLETPTNRLLLWSGLGKPGVKISKEFAERNGYVTLEMTPGGAWLESIGLDLANSPLTGAQTFEIWKTVSRELVLAASGQVNAVVGQVRPKSIFQSIEQSAMLDNPKILGLDILQLTPRMIFK